MTNPSPQAQAQTQKGEGVAQPVHGLHCARNGSPGLIGQRGQVPPHGIRPSDVVWDVGSRGETCPSTNNSRGIQEDGGEREGCGVGDNGSYRARGSSKMMGSSSEEELRAAEGRPVSENNGEYGHLYVASIQVKVERTQERRDPSPSKAI